MGVLQPLFCVRMEPVLLHPHWSRCNKQSFAKAARSQCPWGSTPFLLGLGARACELLCALVCHLAVICVGTSGASQFLSASLGGREVRVRAAKHKKQTASHLCTCTKHLGTRSKCLTAPRLRENVAKHETRNAPHLCTGPKHYGACPGRSPALTLATVTW